MAAGDSISLNLTREEVWREQGLNVPILSSDRVGWRSLNFAYHRQPAHEILTQCRIERAKQLLAKPELTITEILEQVGFKSQSHFTRLFRQYTSTTPKAYRDGL